MQAPPRKADRDQGVVLVVVLLFVLVTSVLVGAIVSQVQASIGNTVIVRNQQALTYGADAGLERGIQAVRRNTTLCPQAGTSGTVGSWAINGRQVNVTCEATQGGSSGVLGYAVIALDQTGDSLTTQGGGTKRISGPVWVGQLESSVTNLVMGGDLYDHAHSGGCTAGDAAPGGVSFAPDGLYSYTCANTTPPVYNPTLPTTAPSVTPVPVDVGTCRTFLPGLYQGSTWPGLLAENYFVSGVYLFENVQINVTSGQKVVGGARAATETALPGLGPCSADSVLFAETGVAAAGTGVKFLLGGSSTLTIGSSSGNAMQLFARRGGAGSEGTQGVTVMQVGAPAGWPNSTLDATDDIITVQSGANPNFAAHGIVYTPSARINVDNATATSSAQFRGGIVTGRLHMQNSGSSTGLVVSIDTEPTVRRLKIRSATKLLATDKEIVAVALVDVSTDVRRSRTILSWRSTN